MEKCLGLKPKSVQFFKQPKRCIHRNWVCHKRTRFQKCNTAQHLHRVFKRNIHSSSCSRTKMEWKKKETWLHSHFSSSKSYHMFIPQINFDACRIKEEEIESKQATRWIKDMNRRPPSLPYVAAILSLA